MKIFKIEITELLQRIVEVEADCIENALEIVEQKYKAEEIILDNTDFIDFEIKETI